VEYVPVDVAEAVTFGDVERKPVLREVVGFMAEQHAANVARQLVDFAEHGSPVPFCV
jgi:hypothetical protein